MGSLYKSASHLDKVGEITTKIVRIEVQQLSNCVKGIRQTPTIALRLG